ncbi:hypothetical protein H0H87_002402 [Tephrocybe sp. NHM501043]|nr:hypothetical protein H0H87_002402 [Tephrocybe sp. NHM501043]
MKRCVSTDEHISKRVKLYTVFDDPELARNPQDVLANGLDDDSGYIACKCFMTWRPTNRKHKAILETMRTVPRLRFDVEFAGACIPFFSNIELKGQDELLLALTSAQIESATVSQVCNIPLKLIYEEGVIIKFVKRKVSEDAKAHEDSWFHDPIDLTGNMEIPSALSSKEQLNTGSASVSELSHASAPVPMLETAPAKPMHHTSSIEAIQDSKLLKKERKKLRKKERALQIACNSGREKEKTAVGGVFAEPTPLATVVHQRTTSHTADVPGSDQNFPRLEPHLSPNQTTAKAPPTGTIALVTPAEQYHHLAALDDAFALIQFNVIGVVVHASALKRTSTGDWSCSLRLADPSNTVVDNLNGREGFVINCFTSKYEGWIPQPSIGEVLVMQDVKFSMHHRYPMGIGYHGKLKWAIYSPSSGRICHSNLKDTPKSDNLAMGGGYAFSPFLNPDEAAIRYCIKMADWWADAEKRRKSIATVHQVGATNFSLSRQGRQHRLISEASPDAPPSGYFDCVVEALNVHSNDNGVYSLYVTDYTINSGVAPVQAEWCPPGLGDYVLKIEVWDNAVAKAQTMYTGEYYSIGNARMRVSRGGYVEGKVVEDKIRRLDDADITHNDHFRKLLERVSFSSAHNFRSHWYRRKKDWQTANQGAEQHDEFKYQIVSEAVEGRHFHCVVEPTTIGAHPLLHHKVLHAKYAGDGASCIYVTDYTSRSELVTGMVQNSWGGAGLDGRILKIVLFNNQAEMAKTVQVGSFYDIKKLRLKQSVTAREFQGHLGGAERLIHLRNPNNAVDDEGLLQALKQYVLLNSRPIKS